MSLQQSTASCLIVPTRFALLLAGLLAACGPQAELEPPDELENASGALLTCPVSLAGSVTSGGTVSTLISGITTLSTKTISYIQASGPDKFTVKAYDLAGWSGVGLPATSATSDIIIGTGVGVSGSFGDPNLLAHITSVEFTDSKTVTLSGTQLGLDGVWRPISGTISYANAEFDRFAKVTFERMNWIKPNAGRLSYQGIESTATKSFLSKQMYYATVCSGVSVAEKGTYGTITFSTTATGITKATYSIDNDALILTSTTSPFSATWDSKKLANGSHTVRLVVEDSSMNRAWDGPKSFNIDNDTTAPTVTADAPTGTGGVITFTATASDTSGVTKVEFYVDNALRGTDLTAPYSVNYDSWAIGIYNGNHTLVAKAYDPFGNIGASASVTFSVYNDKTLPTATALTPTGTTGLITLSANATDNIAVSKVDFYVDNVLRGSDTTAPYSISFDSSVIANNGHTLVVKATDTSGNVGTSTVVLFSVYNLANDLTGPTTTFTISGYVGVITLTATASDLAGVSRVDFERLTSSTPVLIGSVSTAPYVLKYDTRQLVNGTTTLRAVAYDSRGNVAYASAPVITSNTTTVEVEPNNTLPYANVANVWNRHSGGCSPTDVDLFRVAVPAGKTVRAATYTTTSAATGVELQILNAAGVPVVTAATPDVSNEVASYTNTDTSATYKNFYVKVYGQATGTCGYYLTIDY